MEDYFVNLITDAPCLFQEGESGTIPFLCLESP